MKKIKYDRNKEIIKKNVKNINNSVFFICGPEPMKKCVISELKELGVKKEDIKPESELGKDLNLDSVEIADLISIIENEWHIEFDGESILPNLKTFDDLIRIVEEHSNEF